jgi:3-deoxy-D-manno-octulosonic-acid transferase
MSRLADILYAGTLLPHYAWHRFVTKRYGPHAPEKLGRIPRREATVAPGADPSLPPCAWIHAVSVGEAVAARGLLRMLRARHPDWALRVSTTTATGREVAEKEVGAERVFYFPIDFSSAVRRSFDRVRPDLLLLMELEVWPNVVEEAARRGVPVVVVNGRITERSFRRYRRVRPLLRESFRRVRLWCVQTEAYAERFRALGVPEERIRITGSLKYDAVPTHPSAAGRSRYRALLGLEETAPLLVAGSTHPGEEAAVLEAFDRLRRGAGPAAKLLLAPRHPERLREVQHLAARHGPVAYRSELGGRAAPGAAIVLLDTMGELGSLYAAADLVFVGGTLIRHGGQNMLEPVGLARPTVVGPSTHNFADAMAVLREAGGIREIATAAELGPALEAMLTTPVDAALMARRGREALVARQGATRRTLVLLDALIAERESSEA